MQSLPHDVVHYVEKRFPEQQRDEATSILLSARINANETPSPRMLRCALFASNGQLNELRHYVALLLIDWRDVIVAAEYEFLNGNSVHVRDFGLTGII